jgi:hypothetical protein
MRLTAIPLRSHSRVSSGRGTSRLMPARIFLVRWQSRRSVFLIIFEGPLPVATYRIFLSTITPGIDTLSNINLDSNDGPDNTLFAFGELTGLAPLQLVFVGGPFEYNPATGNLLIDIRLSNEVASGGAFYDARSGTAIGVFSRYQNFSAGTHGFGLVTQFTFASVPEPSVIVVLIGGLGGLILARISLRSS